MDKLAWCLRQKGGIQLVKPNANLAEAYLGKSEDALASMRINTVKDWKISTAYYTLYFSLYAVLARIGIKCEIHSCTIEFARRFLNEFFDEEELDFLGESLKARIDAQYYVNRNVSDEQYNEMMKRAPEFLVKCKTVLTQLTEKKLNEIRLKFEELSKE